ncbi:MAG: hypothetical protein RMJ97_11145 [Raineya sp.]|nr:hypothetical protein [Raineya sp.]MDW8297425.1 hypothetical protein [Raineya sp.]
MQKIILALLGFLVVHYLFAQTELSKEEKALLREWEKRKKETTPEQFKALFESKEAKEKELKSLETELNASEQQLSEKNAEIMRLRAKIRELEQKKAEMNSRETEETPDPAPQKEKPQKKPTNKPEPSTNTYQVQVECNGNTLILGVFKTMAEAQKFQSNLRKLQLTGSQIVKN